MKKIGVVIPAFNEEGHIQKCLEALDIAKHYFLKNPSYLNSPNYQGDLKTHYCLNPSFDPKLQQLQRLESDNVHVHMPTRNNDQNEIEIKILVVLDSCTDQTEILVREAGVDLIGCDYRCVGQTRHHGIQSLIDDGYDWICCTDADSMVALNWFEMMVLHQPTDAICGVVDIDSWSHLSEHTQQHYLAHYQDRMDHRHIHGANLCFKSNVYQKLNGFNFLNCHEDVDLVQRMQKFGCHITWSNQLRVKTSARLNSKVTEGFSHFLKKLEDEKQLNSLG